MVSIIVSTSPRFFARVLKRTHNPAHAANGGQCPDRSTGQRAQEGQDEHRMETVPAVLEANGRLRDCMRVNGQIEDHSEGVYYIEWRKDGRRLREAIPNPVAVIERARLKSLELEATRAGALLDMTRAPERHCADLCVACAGSAPNRKPGKACDEASEVRS